MILHNPICITARLLPGVTIGEGWISIEYDGWTDNGRRQYQYHIDLPSYSYSNNELASRVGGGSLQSGLESLLSFLGAFAASVSYEERRGGPGENTNMFPSELAEWATHNSDEIMLVGLELKESTTPLIEEN